MRPLRRSNLNDQVIALAKHLGEGVTLAEFGFQSLGNVIRGYIPVVYAFVHIVLDYNRFARLGKLSYYYTKDTSHKLRNTNRFLKAGAWFFLIFGFAALSFFGSYQNPAAAQQSDISTPAVTMTGEFSGRYITVTYIEPINVRSGPSSLDYPIVGSLPVGATAPAIGRSPAGEWIQIEFPDAPRGKGWIYAANVTLSTGALLPIVEPPPTPAPLETATLNPTYVAAFEILPTTTRLPTFTAPPALVMPTYVNPARFSNDRNITTWVIVVMGLIGIVGMILTSFRRR